MKMECCSREVSLEADMPALKQFFSRYSKSCIDMPHILESFDKGVIDCQVYVDQLTSSMSCVAIVMPQCSTQPYKYIGAFSTNYDKLEKLLLSLPNIDYSTDKLIITGESHLMQRFYVTMTRQLGGRMQTKGTAECYTLEGTIGRDVATPSGYSVGVLHSTDMGFISSKLPYTVGQEEAKWFQFIHQNFNSVAIYYKANGSSEIAAWVFESIGGNLTHLYTLPGHRHKGLATVAVHEMCKRLQLKGRIPFCFIGTENEPSIQLFTALGFQRSGSVREWLFVNL